jgi:hypothetical protein
MTSPPSLFERQQRQIKLLTFLLTAARSLSFTSVNTRSSICSRSISLTSSRLFLAKTRRKDESASYKSNANNDINQWYEPVDSNASPADIFSQEMQRQRLMNEIGDQYSLQNEIAATTTTTTTSRNSSERSNSNGSGSGYSNNNVGSNSPNSRPIANMPPPPPTLEQQKSAEAALAEYTMYMVSDNWLDDDLIEHFQILEEEAAADNNDNARSEELSLEEQSASLEKQLEEMDDSRGVGNNMGDKLWAGDEPWDFWDEPEDLENPQRLRIDPTNNKGTYVPISYVELERR